VKVVKVLILFAGIVLVIYGLTVAQDGQPVRGVAIAVSTILFGVAGERIAGAVVAWRDRQPKPPRATVIKRRAS
jgi:hypothetical protein